MKKEEHLGFNLRKGMHLGLDLGKIGPRGREGAEFRNPKEGGSAGTLKKEKKRIKEGISSLERD